MPDFSSFLQALQGASNGVASNLSGPIDLLSMGLRKAGLPIPENAFGGSQWLAEKGLTKPTQGLSGAIGEGLGSAASVAAPAKSAQIASALLKAQANAAAPRTLNSQAGAILVPKTWLGEKGYGLSPVGPSGRPLAEIPVSGNPNMVALPRKVDPRDTPLGYPSSMMQRGVSLGEIAPEIRGTPLEKMKVSFDNQLADSTRGAFDPQAMELLLNPKLADNPMQALSVLHHEATHGAQNIQNLAGKGASPDLFTNPDWVHGLEQGFGEASQRMGMQLRSDANARMNQGFNSPFTGYRLNQGEQVARVAGNSTPFEEVPQSVLEKMAQKEHMPFGTFLAQERFTGHPLLLPSQGFEQGWMSMDDVTKIIRDNTTRQPIAALFPNW